MSKPIGERCAPQTAQEVLRIAFEKDDRDRTSSERMLVLAAYRLVKKDRVADQEYLLGLALKVLADVFKKSPRQRSALEILVVKMAYDAVERESTLEAGCMHEPPTSFRRH